MGGGPWSNQDDRLEPTLVLIAVAALILAIIGLIHVAKSPSPRSTIRPATPHSGEFDVQDVQDETPESSPGDVADDRWDEWAPGEIPDDPPDDREPDRARPLHSEESEEPADPGDDDLRNWNDQELIEPPDTSDELDVDILDVSNDRDVSNGLFETVPDPPPPGRPVNARDPDDDEPALPSFHH